jgi:hypothetical protein
MFGFFTPILLLQAFCVYHVYRTNAEQRWYWLIIFFPLVGCLIYLYHHFYNRNTVSSITEGMKEVVNSNYKVEQLEKALRFSDNVTNKINLADAYVECRRFKDAINLYKDSRKGFMADDKALGMKLLSAHFYNDDYADAVALGAELENEKSFKNSEERVAFAWALYFNEQQEKASSVFEDMDKSFTNYYHRTEYAKFLMKINRVDEARTKLTDLMEEFEHMKEPEKKLKRNTFREIRDLYSNMAKA